MAKKINFPLEMADGYTVRYELEEYRAHFNLVKAIEHFTSGKLIEWMENNLYEEIAESLGQLDKDAPDFPQRLCEILGVEMPETADENPDIDAIQRTQEKEKTLRQKTSDEKIIANAAKTAFHRGDLVELLKAGEKTIYLCGDAFDIPIRKENVRYIGVLGTPKITIGAKSREELAEKNITFENVEMPEKLREAPAPVSVEKSVESSSEPRVKLSSPTRKFTAEELLEAAGRFHLKSFLGFGSDDYGFGWVVNEIKHGNEFCDIDKREKKINAILRRNDVLDNSGEMSESAVFHKFTELFEVSEKNSKFLETNINKLEDTIKAAILWQMKYMVALKLEPCDDPLDYGQDENAEWTLDTLYEAISNEPEEAAEKPRLKMKSCVGIVSDGLMYHTGNYGTFNMANAARDHGDRSRDIDWRKKKITEVLRKYLDSSPNNSISEDSVLTKYAEMFNVPEQTKAYIKSKLDNLHTQDRENIVWEIKYTLAITLEPSEEWEYGPMGDDCIYTLDEILELLE